MTNRAHHAKVERSSSSKAVGAVFFAACLLAFIFLLVRPKAIVRDAHSYVEAMRDGDGDALYGAAIQSERECSDLSPTKIHQAWLILIQPLLANSRFVKSDPVALESNQTQAVGALRYVNKLGDPWTLDIIANQSSEGTKANVIYGMLATASLFDADGHANATLTQDLALDGVHRYRQRLESIGIHSIMLSPGSCISWDQLEAKLQPKHESAPRSGT